MALVLLFFFEMREARLEKIAAGYDSNEFAWILRGNHGKTPYPASGHPFRCVTTRFLRKSNDRFSLDQVARGARLVGV